MTVHKMTSVKFITRNRNSAARVLNMTHVPSRQGRRMTILSQAFGRTIRPGRGVCEDCGTDGAKIGQC
jgi:hypothetical protein